MLSMHSTPPALVLAFVGYSHRTEKHQHSFLLYPSLLYPSSLSSSKALISTIPHSSPYEKEHAEFVFLCLDYLIFIVSSSSVHVSANNKLSFFGADNSPTDI